jgi:PTH1 family peptidyl-tRNA hydrolase
VRLLRRSRPEGGDRWAIIGLGNPGERYAGTRHNVGVMVVERLLERAGASLKRHKSGCLIAETRLAGEAAVIGRTTSYMNESGRPIRELTRWYNVAPGMLIVVHDEIDLPFETLRIKSGGGTAGHNGLKSIVSHLGTNEFARLRVGVGRPRGEKAAAGHVLNEFSGAERKALADYLDRAAEAVERIVEIGLERAMNEVNTRQDG